MFSKLAVLTLTAALAFPMLAQAAPLKVAVSILPQKYFVEQIGGDNVDVSVIVPPGAEPESFAPTIREMEDLSDTTLYFTMGVPFEKAWLPRFTGVNPQMEVMPLYDRICLRAWPAGVGDDDGDAKGSQASDTPQTPCRPERADPHSWMSPALVRIMAGTIRDTLIEKDPANAEDYWKNFRAFAEEIDAVDKGVLDAIANIGPNKSFMVYHPAFGYFARAYGLHQLPVENMGTEPTPGQLENVVKEAREKGIKVIFVQPQFSQKAARTVADEIGGQVVAVDPLAPDWGSNLQSIAKTFANALN